MSEPKESTPQTLSVWWRWLIVAAGILVAFAAATVAVASAVPVQSPPPLEPALRLPAPTGKHAVGTFSQRWVDSSRPDPFVAGKRRELMVQVWYPATDAEGSPAARYLPARTARALGAPVLDTVAVHARVGAPFASGRHPVLLFSPGFGVPRFHYAALLEDLASRGFVVVSPDHPYDAQIVEFPDGRLVRTRLKPGPRAIALRVADTHFVVDRLPYLNGRGRLAGKLDLSRTGILGHSLGGAVAAELVGDPRVDAGANLDGSFFGKVAQRGVGDPFLVMSAPRNAGDPTHKAYRARLSRSQLDLTLRKSEHFTFTDFVAIGRPLDALVPGILGALPVGTIDPDRALAAQRSYLGAFFGAHLRGISEPLLQRASRAYPEVRFRRGGR